MKAKIHSGHCLCGRVRYAVEGDPVIVAHCHCDDCQRLTGSGHSTGAMFPVDSLRLEGDIAEYELTSENGNRVTRVFCPNCGSPILGKNSAMQGFATLNLGTMDDSSDLMPGVTVFARNRKPWDVLDESIQTYDAQPVWNPRD